MSKVIKKPMATVLILMAIIGMISYMSITPSSLGNVSPVTLDKYSEIAVPPTQDSFNSQEKSDEDVVRRPKSGEKEKDVGGAIPGDETGSGASPVEASGDLTETAFMPKMANETLKAELGNASWRLFHTILARYPDAPSKQEQSTLFNYIHLFAQVYPCGDCARHFQKLLAKYPPQIKSRKSAAIWGCDIHNKVNGRLDKPMYDCTKILEDYDCGCGSDEKEVDYTLGQQSMDSLRNVKVEKEEKQLGG
ncbi:FAD-linked sulfhydryl oxidase Erv2p [[Candida] anglica]|uniref:Sulfhydryl oxidase n=1 Tax=[Candida] anglica TaxID=148631 RepID=A0ABP0ENR0_9ASCO